MIQSYKKILDNLNHLLSSLTLIEGNNVKCRGKCRVISLGSAKKSYLRASQISMYCKNPEIVLYRFHPLPSKNL